jgi:hypothetical protein
MTWIAEAALAGKQYARAVEHLEEALSKGEGYEQRPSRMLLRNCTVLGTVSGVMSRDHIA